MISSLPESATAPNTDSTASDLDLLPTVVQAVQATGDHMKSLFSTSLRAASRQELMERFQANDATSVGVLRPMLEQARPGALWVDDEEEGGLLPPGECWIVDPVEGNINYIHGMPDWGVTATLVRDNVPVLAVVYLPLIGATYSAVRGAGARLNGVALNTSAKTDLGAAIMATGQAKPDEDVKIYQQIGESVTAMLKVGALLRVYVPVTLLLVEIAAGRMDGFWQFGQVRVGLLAGALMVEEAGGTISDTRGGQWTTASEDFLATAPGIHKAATHVLSKIA